MMIPAPGKESAVLAALRDAHPHYKVYAKQELPERLHFRDNPRIPAVVAVADEGWAVVRKRSEFEQQGVRLAGATHGYDNAVGSMRALFIARGPAFKSGLDVEPFENVHLYEMLTAILGLDPAPNDGNAEVLRPLLRRSVWSRRATP